MDFIEVTINNWEKYNKRKDIKKPWWFALSNTLIADPDFVTFTAEEFRAWIYILSQASLHGSPTVPLQFPHSSLIVRLMYKHASSVCRIKKVSLERCLNKLFLLKICTRSGETRSGSVQHTTGQDRTGHNITTQGHNAVRDFDNRFSKGAAEIKVVLDKIFENKIPPKINRNIGKLVGSYNGMDHFVDSMDAIINSDKALELKAENPVKYNNYITVSILREIGAMS